MTREIDGWELAYYGRMRDLYYLPQHPSLVLMVASDRVGAFDHVLEPGIPGKGELLAQLNRWWFGQLTTVQNHLVDGPAPNAVAARSMVVRSLTMFPIECVVRGHLAGSAWAEYQRSRSICGLALPERFEFGDRLLSPIYTPAFKAPLGEHDETITFERTADLVGARTAQNLRELSPEVYSRAAAIAETHGILIADTKFGFGIDSDGTVILADEVLTSDSSRYWDAPARHRGERHDGFDKQVVRNWLSANGDPAIAAASRRRSRADHPTILRTDHSTHRLSHRSHANC